MHPIVPACPSLFTKAYPSAETLATSISRLSITDEVIPKRLYALQARANLEYQFTRKFGIFATGGYGLTRFYNKSSNYDKGAIIEAGIVLF